MTDALKILIIEDDPDVALGCEQALQLEGFTAEVAGSAEQGSLELSTPLGTMLAQARWSPAEATLVTPRAQPQPQPRP